MSTVGVYDELCVKSATLQNKLSLNHKLTRNMFYTLASLQLT